VPRVPRVPRKRKPPSKNDTKNDNRTPDFQDREAKKEEKNIPSFQNDGTLGTDGTELKNEPSNSGVQNENSCMSRKVEQYISAVEGFQYSMKEFKAEWDNLKANVDLLLGDLDSGKDPDKFGTEVKKSSYRLSLHSYIINITLHCIVGVGT